MNPRARIWLLASLSFVILAATAWYLLRHRMPVRGSAGRRKAREVFGQPVKLKVAATPSTLPSPTASGAPLSDLPTPEVCEEAWNFLLDRSLDQLSRDFATFQRYLTPECLDASAGLEPSVSQVRGACLAPEATTESNAGVAQK